MSKVQNNTQSQENLPVNISCNRMVAAYFQCGYKAMILGDLWHFNKSKIDNSKLKHGLPLVFYSAAELTKSKFIFLKARTFSNYLKFLSEDGILFSAISNKYGRDVTLNYIVNFEKYNAIMNGRSYPKAATEEFLKLCSDAVRNNSIDCKTLDSTISKFYLPFVNSANGLVNSANGLVNSANGLVNSANAIGKICSTLPINTLPNNKTNNTPNNLINLENQKSSISTFKDIFKKNNIEFTPKTSDEVFLKIYHNIEAKIKAYKDENKINSKLTPQNVFDALILILSIIKQRINDESKYNLNYFSKAIKDEPKETFFGKKQNEKQSWAQQNGKILDRNNYRLAKEQGGNVFVVHEKPTFAERSGKIISSEHFRIAAEQIGNGNSKVFVGHEKQSWAENKNGKTEKSKNTVLETVKTGSAKNTVFESFSDEQKIDKIRKELEDFKIPFEQTEGNAMLEMFNFLQKHNPQIYDEDNFYAIFEKCVKSFHALFKVNSKNSLTAESWNLQCFSNYTIEGRIN
jgi:hypothetical protein